MRIRNPYAGLLETDEMQIFNPPKIEKAFLNLFNPKVDFDADRIFGSFTMMLGLPGCGKSYGLHDFMEEFVDFGIPFCAIDSHSEYSVISSLPNSNIKVFTEVPKNSIEPIQRLLERRSCIFDFFKGLEEEYVPFLLEFFHKLYETRRAEVEKMRKENPAYVPSPIILIIDEAYGFIPREGYLGSVAKELRQQKTQLKKWSEILVKGGRKFGISLIVASQRPSDINTNLSQMGQICILMRARGVRDLQVFADLSGVTFQESCMLFKNLKDGDAIIFMSGTDGIPVHFRRTNPRLPHPSKTATYASLVANEEG